MKLKSLILMIGISLATWGIVIQSAQAQTRLAIHATQAEVNIWKQRQLSGPYLDEWNRIKSRADSFRASPTGKWRGNQQNQPWSGDSIRDCKRLPTTYPGGSSSDCAGNNGRAMADNIRDAGFVYVLTGDTSYRDAVRKLLLEQASEPGTDFSNTTRWPTSYVNEDKDFQISLWVRKMAYAYSYIRNSLSGGDRATLDTWFRNAATWMDTMVHNAAKNRYPHRLNDNYSVVGTCGGKPSILAPVTHFGGFEPRSFGYAWDNKAANHVAAVSAVAATINDTTLMLKSKRWFKEWLRANVWSDGTVWEQGRWGSGTPETGWNYATALVGTAISIADHIARAGDTELYTYTTMAGDCGSAGGPKSLQKILRRYADIALGNITIYASTTATTDPKKRIYHYGSRVDDVAFAQANIFYQDPLLQKSYTRAMPAKANYGGYDPWGGDWGNLPGARFMFGQIEGKVWPYSILGPQPLPVPTNLRTVSSGQ